jgi:signal peptidase I
VPVFWRRHLDDIYVMEESKLSKKILFILSIVIVLILLLVAFSGCTESDMFFYVESDCMSHGERQEGIIDKGDFILCEEISDKNELITWVFGKSIDYKKYGDYGDVIVYKNESDKRIISRIMCWVEYYDEFGTYSIEDYGFINVSGITIPELGLENYTPNNSGFISKEDNRSLCDQLRGLCNGPVKLEWIIGNVVKLIDMKRVMFPRSESLVPRLG